MTEYVRPVVEERIFRDAAGRPVEYGSRWGDGGPPEDTYSVVSNPDRFAPLHAIAEGLITHLRTTYEVGVREGAELADDLLHGSTDVDRAVRVTPAEPDAAPLTFAFTAFPGVIVHAGLLHDFAFPGCGCDACDETWDTQAEELEELVFSVVSGGYRESVRRGADLGVEYWLAGPGRRRHGGARPQDFAAGRLVAAEDTLRRLGGAWHPWPRRLAT